jgi:eukaryotic-like serine/threonine-protein kinase
MVTTPSPNATSTAAESSSSSHVGSAVLAAHERPTPAAREEDSAIRTANAAQRSECDEDVIRTAEQFLDALHRLGTQGGKLRIAPEADLELSAAEFTGTAQWRIEAVPGPKRPRIRFRPSLLVPTSPTVWPVLFNLCSGSLRVQGLDILIQDSDAPRTGGLAAIGVAAGTELVVTDCTITITGNHATAAAVVVQPVSEEIQPLPTDIPPKAAVVKVRDSFLRSAGDCFNVTPDPNVTADHRLDLELQNVLIGTDGSLLHALGGSRTARNETALNIKIDQVLARTKEGLVHLEGTIDGPKLPLADIVAENSIFSLPGQGDPLFRVDGQGDMEDLRDCIRWKAEHVGYHQITTYRRDQILQTGVSPLNYTRSDWSTAFAPKDESPVIGDLKFLHNLAPARPSCALTKEELRLAPDSPALKSGPDLERIPAPPPADS